MQAKQQSPQQSPRRAFQRADQAKRAQRDRGARTRSAAPGRDTWHYDQRPLPGAVTACSAVKNCSRFDPATLVAHVDRISGAVRDKPRRLFRVALKNPNSLTLEDAILRCSALRCGKGFRVDGNDAGRSVVDEVHDDVLCCCRSGPLFRPRTTLYAVTSDLSTTFDCAPQQIAPHSHKRPNNK